MATVTGGDKLEKVLRELSAKLSAGAVLKAGFLEGSTDPEGNSIPLRAAVNNFGAPSRGIPPRPFFTNCVADNADVWGRGLAENLKLTDNNVKLSLERVGLKIKEDIQLAIRNTTMPPLKPATIARKGFAKPLIDTSDMINSVDFEVTE